MAAEFLSRQPAPIHRTNPENGTTTHFYNADGTLDYKTDAKGQKITYTYDSLHRVTAVRRYTNSTTEDTAQRTDFEYDGNSVASGFSQNVSGRLGVATSRVDGTAGLTTFHEMYSYDAAGRVLKKRLRVSRNYHTVDKDLEYTYTGALLNTMKYPDSSTPYTYAYDNMLRPNGMTGPSVLDTTIDVVKNVSYNVAGRMTAYSSLSAEYDPGCGEQWCIEQTYLGHAFTFNERNELTRQQSGSVADISYEYSATADNGQILSRTNGISHEKVSYQYDALKRLVAASAVSTTNQATTWASTYGYDGFGNLLSKTPTAGSAPSLSVTVNGATNRINSGGMPLGLITLSNDSMRVRRDAIFLPIQAEEATTSILMLMDRRLTPMIQTDWRRSSSLGLVKIIPLGRVQAVRCTTQFRVITMNPILVCFATTGQLHS